MATINDVDLQTLAAGIGNAAYNPQLVGPDWAKLVQYVMAGQRARKENKRQLQMEEEDRALKKRLVEAQISNYAEPNYYQHAEKEIPDYPAEQVKSLATKLNYPQEFIDSIPGMNKSARSNAMAKLLDEVRALGTAGKRLPTKAPTEKGKRQQRALELGSKMVNGWANQYRTAQGQLEANPQLAAMAPGKIDELRNKVLRYESVAGEIQAMLSNIDDNGELSEADYARMVSILKNPANIETAGIGMPKATPTKKAEETKTNVQPSGQEKPPAQSGTHKGQTATNKKTGKVWTWDGTSWK